MPLAKNNSETPPRTRRRAADRKRDILLAAREVFSEKGYEQTSIAEIASKVGVVEGAIYKHVATKRDLLFEAMCTFYGPMIAQTREQLAGVQGTRNRLRFLIWRQLKGFADEPGICRLVIQDIRPRHDYHDSVVHELNRESTSLVLGVIEEGIEGGEFRADLPAAMVRDMIYGGIEHVAWKTLSGRGAIDIDEVADDMSELIMRGIEIRAEEAGEREEARAKESEAATAERERLEAQVDRLERVVDAIAGRGDENSAGGAK